MGASTTTTTAVSPPVNAGPVAVVPEAIAALCKEALRLILKHQAVSSTPLYAGTLGKRLRALGAWPVPGVSGRLQDVIQAEPRLLVETQGRMVYITLRPRTDISGRSTQAHGAGTAGSSSSSWVDLAPSNASQSVQSTHVMAKAPRSRSVPVAPPFAQTALAAPPHMTPRTQCSPGCRLQPGHGPQLAAAAVTAPDLPPPGPGEAMQHATMPATATATACAPLLKRLRAAAVQLVLDHQARGKQPMSAPELEAQLKRDGAWPLRGVSTRLDRALKGEAHLFVLDVGSSVYYYATQVISARQRVVCDAAVAALEEHLPWEGWFRQGRRTLPIDDLAGALTHEHALAVTGEELQGALQADPRIVLGGDGKRSWAGLWRAGSLPLPQGAPAGSACAGVVDAKQLVHVSPCALTPLTECAPADDAQVVYAAALTGALTPSNAPMAASAAAADDPGEPIPHITSPATTADSVPFHAHLARARWLQLVAVQLVLEHQACSQQPMPAPELEQQLGDLGVWLVRGENTGLHAGLKDAAHLFTLTEGSTVYYYANTSASSKQRVVCDAAVAALAAHKAGGMSKERKDASALALRDLRRSLMKEGVWPIKGKSLLDVLQQDPRIVVDRTGRQPIAHLWQSGSLPVPEGRHTAAELVNIMRATAPQAEAQQLPMCQQEQQNVQAVAIQTHQPQSVAGANTATASALTPPVHAGPAAGAPHVLAALCASVLQLVMENDVSASTRMNVGTLGKRLRALGAWPVPGVSGRLQDVIQAEPRLLVERETLAVYITLRPVSISGQVVGSSPMAMATASAQSSTASMHMPSGATATAAVAAAAAAPSMTGLLLPSSGLSTQTLGHDAHKAARTTIAAPTPPAVPFAAARADPGQQVMQRGTPSATSGHPTARATPIEVLLAAALQMVLDHHKQYKQPMLDATLDQHLRCLGVWPLPGHSKPLQFVLKQEPCMFTLKDGYMRYYYARKGAGTRAMSAKHRAVCNAAVEALLTHKDKTSEGSLRLSQLQRLLGKRKVWRGGALDRVLQDDPRMTVRMTGKNLRVQLWLAQGVQVSFATALSSQTSAAAALVAKMNGCTALQQTQPQQTQPLQPQQMQPLQPQQTQPLQPQQTRSHQQTGMQHGGLAAQSAQCAHVQAVLGYNFHNLQRLQSVLAIWSKHDNSVRMLAREGHSMLRLCLVAALLTANPKLTAGRMDALQCDLLSKAALTRWAHVAGLIPQGAPPLTVKQTAAFVGAVFGALHADCSDGAGGSQAAQERVVALLDKHSAIGTLAEIALNAGKKK